MYVFSCAKSYEYIANCLCFHFKIFTFTYFPLSILRAVTAFITNTPVSFLILTMNSSIRVLGRQQVESKVRVIQKHTCDATLISPSSVFFFLRFFRVSGLCVYVMCPCRMPDINMFVLGPGIALSVPGITERTLTGVIKALWTY